MKRYLLDSNVFIQAHRMHYPFDVVPGFWEKLIDLADRGLIISIDKVRKEIIYKPSDPDVLGEWCLNSLQNDFFASSEDCVGEYGEIVNWVNSNSQYDQSAKDEFMATDLADSWLIAYAKRYDCILVTYEISAPGSKKKIKIPDPCRHFGISCITPIEMFRELKENF